MLMKIITLPATLLLILIFLASSASPDHHRKFNVHDFGAKGDGITDDSKAFNEAWKRACNSWEKHVVVLVPNSKYMLKPVNFSGPCNSDQITFKIKGKIVASENRSDYEKDTEHWLVFEEIHNLRVDGGGTGIFDGKGRVWWQTSCKVNRSLAVTFIGCTKLRVENLKFRNAQKMHLSFERCEKVRALNLRLTAPEHSPNTDGIHVEGTHNINIRNCVMRTGDDCISIVSGSKNVRATDITCGPGHGISIGSLGARNSSANVSNVFVNRAIFSGTTNGLRIKTWQGGSGYAKKIRFENITMHNVTNPIIIDQYYCDQVEPCQEQVSAVQISKVVYRSIQGTSSAGEAIRFNCSKHFPCQGILLEDINLKSYGDVRQSAKASCSNVKFKIKGKASPSC
ncbi:polygalacturonase-like isoform X2 [Ziziphus jujuba]|uniref:Polygalacturonase-like isoform X2 n=1 Tax=Ziziphus jujuba TaxID=326968 RepID=A0ABM4A1I8_ZIZJJ|nr:polygalacturonase-like isoform X2 [Ziziphus jujuba]